MSPILHADKGYDGNAIRYKVEGKGTMPNIPPQVASSCVTRRIADTLQSKVILPKEVMDASMLMHSIAALGSCIMNV